LLCCAMLSCAVLYSGLLCCAVVSGLLCCCCVLLCAVVCYCVLLCAVLCCAVLCCAVVCCVVLCCEDRAQLICSHYCSVICYGYLVVLGSGAAATRDFCSAICPIFYFLPSLASRTQLPLRHLHHSIRTDGHELYSAAASAKASFMFLDALS